MTNVSPITPVSAVSTRLLFIDNIRWTLIALVICHHAACTYGQAGSWYLQFPTQSLATRIILLTFLVLNQAFFMGFLFFFAGYFSPGAFDDKGFSRFLRDRAIRLGIPSAFFMLVIHPFTVYWLLRRFYDPSRPSLVNAYPAFLTSGKVLSSSGPMWFALALLIFCAVYALIRLITPATAMPSRPPQLSPLPGHLSVLVFLLVMATCTFLVRLVQPIGVSILNMQFCFFSQYILLYALGIRAYRNNWLRRIDYSFGILWMKLACLAGIPAWFLLLTTSGFLNGGRDALGGWHWQSAAFCLWESFFCVGMCLGLTVLFRDRFNTQSRVTEWLSRNSFSAYLFHTPLLVAVTLALQPFPAPALFKFVIAGALAVPITFLVSGLIRERIPGIRQIL